MRAAGGPLSLKDRLEGRWDVLEVTRLRYRALVSMVRAWMWRDRLRSNGPLVHQVALAQPVVDELLDRTLRRAEAEGWPRSDETMRLLEEVNALRHELRARVLKRLGRDAEEGTLTELLLDLEASLASQRKIEPGQKWAAAHEILPWSLPELIRASERGDVLERLMKRPMDLQGPLPFSVEEADLLAQAVPEAIQAIATVWRRVDQVDPTGALQRFLARRARRAPLRAPRSGPEALLRSVFWLDYARSAVRQCVEPKVAPVPVADYELFPLLQWLVRLQRDPSTRLEPSNAIPDAKGGLFELAQELQRANRLSLPAVIGHSEVRNRMRNDLGNTRWDALRIRAQRAEPLRDTPEAAGVLHVLTRFIRMRTPDRAEREGPLDGNSFEVLIQRAAEMSQR